MKDPIPATKKEQTPDRCLFFLSVFSKKFESHGPERAANYNHNEIANASGDQVTAEHCVKRRAEQLFCANNEDKSSKYLDHLRPQRRFRFKMNPLQIYRVSYKQTQRAAKQRKSIFSRGYQIMNGINCKNLFGKMEKTNEAKICYNNAQKGKQHRNKNTLI